MHPNFRWALHLHRGASAVIYVKHSWNIYEEAKIAKEHGCFHWGVEARVSLDDPHTLMVANVFCGDTIQQYTVVCQHFRY